MEEETCNFNVIKLMAVFTAVLVGGVKLSQWTGWAAPARGDETWMGASGGVEDGMER